MRYIWTNLHLPKKIYTGTARGARDKYQVCDRLASEGGEVGEEDVGGDLDAGGDGGDEQPGQEEEGARKEDAEEEREAR